MEERTKWIVHAAVRSGMGNVRKNNEDAFFFNGYYRPLREMDQESSVVSDFPLQGALFAVCDGMGGQNNGEVASYLAVSGINGLRQYLNGREFASSLQSWVKQASKAIGEKTDGGGCTMALIYFQQNLVCYAHIGDSRIYRWSKGELTRLTRDHSKIEMMLSAGIITAEEAKNHPQRHVITRHLGMRGDNPCEATVGRQLPLMNEDRFILCSDGITDMLSDEHIARICVAADSAEQCAEELYSTALVQGGRDNLTVIVLDLESDGNELYMMDDEEEDPTVETGLVVQKCKNDHCRNVNFSNLVQQKENVSPLQLCNKSDRVIMTNTVYVVCEENGSNTLKVTSKVIY